MSVLASTALVMQQATHLHIDHARIEALASQMMQQFKEHSFERNLQSVDE